MRSDILFEELSRSMPSQQIQVHPRDTRIRKHRQRRSNHDKAREWLKAQERNGKIKTVIFGEDFSIFNFRSLELKNRYHELDSLMKVCNHGVTVVEL